MVMEYSTLLMAKSGQGNLSMINLVGMVHGMVSQKRLIQGGLREYKFELKFL